jgi:hypothetical protein
MSDQSINMFDHCQLATSTSGYFKKIRNTLEDSFNVNTYFGCTFDEKPNSTMTLDINTGELVFRERTTSDHNTINSKRVVVVHYFLQIAIWMIYNTLIDQRQSLSCVLDNFYDYMFGPIMTSIVFHMNPKINYTSELPSVYLECVPIVTEIQDAS